MRVALVIVLFLALLLQLGARGDTEGMVDVVLTLEDVLNISVCPFLPAHSPGCPLDCEHAGSADVKVCLFSRESEGALHCQVSGLGEAWPALIAQFSAPGTAEVWVDRDGDDSGEAAIRRQLLYDPDLLGLDMIASSLLPLREELVLLGGIAIKVVALSKFEVRVRLSAAIRNGLPDLQLLEAEPLLLQRRVGELLFLPIPSVARGYLTLEDFSGQNNLPGEGYGYYLLLDLGRLEGCRAGDRLEFILKFTVEDVTDL